jgi:hypothetical protein
MVMVIMRIPIPAIMITALVVKSTMHRHNNNNNNSQRSKKP